MEQNYFKHRFNSLTEKYPLFKTLQDYHLFVMLCVKYYFYGDGSTHFDQEIALDYLTDGKNDGGIDAIFNDPNSDGNDVIIVQSKYYEDSPLSASDIAGELYKINETLAKLQSNKVSEFNEKMVTAYKNAMSQKEDDGKIRICFFTSYEPKNKRERTALEKSMEKYFNSFEYELYCRSDIEAQIELCENGKICVDFDQLTIDKEGNYLSYEDSVIVNISALSLQNLQNRRRNGLLGMNLRYYVKQKDVDSGINETITNDRENFWYKNNGVLIVCSDFKIEKTTLKLKEFSIVNGGQTTNRIGNADIPEDFYLQCKVVKSKGQSKDEKDLFVHNIAEATNSQKPIKKADLLANTPEQLRLKEELYKYGVYYITKKGDRAPKQFSLPYQSCSLEQVGKVSMAGILQMPGSSRSNSARMYDKDYYNFIFGKSKYAGVISDLLKINYYYDCFLKTDIKGKGYDEKTVLPMLKNGKTFQLAAIMFLCKIERGIFTYDTVAGLLKNVDDLKNVLRSMDDMTTLIRGQIDNEEELFYNLFSIIGEDVLGYCFDDAVERAEDEQKTIAPSDYLKSDNNYYRYVLKRLWSMYNKKSDIKNAIALICGSKK